MHASSLRAARCNMTVSLQYYEAPRRQAFTLTGHSTRGRALNVLSNSSSNCTHRVHPQHMSD